MRIDSHQHFWNYDSERHSWISDDMSEIRKNFGPLDLSVHLKQNNIEGSVVVQVDQTEDETNYLLGLANDHTLIKGVVGWIDLKSKDLRSRLEYYKQFKKLKGFRHIVQAENEGFLSDQAFIDGVRLLGEFGFTYDLLIYHYQLEEALKFVSNVSDVKIVLDHIGKPSIRTKEKTKWELYIAALSTFDNVYCKVSGMTTEAHWTSWKVEDFYPYLDEVFDSFGASRLMYGSDWPVCLVAATYEQQLDILTTYIESLSAEERNKIMGDTALDFYQL